MKEDNFTSTVDGAAAAEAYRLYISRWDDYDNDGAEFEESEEEVDECGCSDPSCPCSGNKIGTP